MPHHGTPSTADADWMKQLAVLTFVLTLHPALLTADEIERECGADDAAERALYDLTGAGLLRREGATVLPTRAALHFNCLEQQ
jgi:hypothetical protein